MAVTEIAQSIPSSFGVALDGYSIAKLLGFSVNSDTEIDVGAIDARGLGKCGIQLTNKHASNSLDYHIFGSNLETLPASYVAEDWEEAVANTALAIDTSKVEEITKAYSWLLIRAKRTVASNDSTLDVNVTGKK